MREDALEKLHEVGDGFRSRGAQEKRWRKLGEEARNSSKDGSGALQGWDAGELEVVQDRCDAGGAPAAVGDG